MPDELLTFRDLVALRQRVVEAESRYAAAHEAALSAKREWERLRGAFEAAFDRLATPRPILTLAEGPPEPIEAIPDPRD
jgi:hypothetical protein